jgi:condensation enzyme
MTQPSQTPGLEPTRFPLSHTQEWFCSMDQGDHAGAFGPHFVMVAGWRITGEIDTAALQAALDDVVERHELLRTVVAREAKPPCQQVYPPCQVPLQIRDLVPASGQSRDVSAEELLIDAGQTTMNPREVPLLRATLGQFDDSDSVLILITHHSACDGWSMQLMMRDLSALYEARTSCSAPKLPDVQQYGEYAKWQQIGSADSGTDEPPLEHWRERLSGAQIFTLPTDRPIPRPHTRPYSLYKFVIEADMVAAASMLGRSMRSSLFMVELAAFNVLAYQITGTTDPVISALTTGRNEPRFQNTVGLFLNLAPFRTDIGDCVSFRDIIARTRETCIDAYSHEIPFHHIELGLPEVMAPHDDNRKSQLVLGMFQPPSDGGATQLADGADQIFIRHLPEPEHPDPPQGVVWQMDLLESGAQMSSVQFNLDELDQRTVVGWAGDYCRILARAVEAPDQDWKSV